MTNTMRKIVCVLVCLMVVAASVLTFTSCTNTKTDASDTVASAQDTATDTAKAEEKTISIIVVDDKGEEKEFSVTTAEKYLRGALEQIKLIEGEESDYGLYVKVVDGLIADYDADGAYWAFYIGDEYLTSGVDTTEIADGDVYRIVYTK